MGKHPPTTSAAQNLENIVQDYKTYEKLFKHLLRVHSLVTIDAFSKLDTNIPLVITDELEQMYLHFATNTNRN